MSNVGSEEFMEEVQKFDCLFSSTRETAETS